MVLFLSQGFSFKLEQDQKRSCTAHLLLSAHKTTSAKLKSASVAASAHAATLDKSTYLPEWHPSKEPAFDLNLKAFRPVLMHL